MKSGFHLILGSLECLHLIQSSLSMESMEAGDYLFAQWEMENVNVDY